MIGAAIMLKFALFRKRQLEQQQERLNTTVFLGRKPHKSLRALTKPIRATYEIAPLDETEVREQLYGEK